MTQPLTVPHTSSHPNHIAYPMKRRGREWRIERGREGEEEGERGREGEEEGERGEMYSSSSYIKEYSLTS